MGWCKKDVTPLLTHWSYVFLALTHRYVFSSICEMIEHPAFTDLDLYFIQHLQAVSAMLVTYVPGPLHLTMLM